MPKRANRLGAGNKRRDCGGRRLCANKVVRYVRTTLIKLYVSKQLTERKGVKGREAEGKRERGEERRKETNIQ